MNWKKFLIIIFLALNLQGCAFIAIGGAAAATTYFILHDHRSDKIKNTDDQLVGSINAKLNEEPEFRRQSHIIVAAFHGTVLLAGQTQTQELKQQAARIASTTPGIALLYNQITVTPPNSTLKRINDEWINIRIRTKIAGIKALKSAQVKIITESGIVYLMGRATYRQQRIITNIARKVPNVKKVVKVFS